MSCTYEVVGPVGDKVKDLRQKVIRVHLHGVRGEIDRESEKWYLFMIAHERRDDKQVNYEKAGTGSFLRAFTHLLSTRCCYYNSR
jgi:hypothetical protein